MSNHVITGEDYRIEYDVNSTTVQFSGILSLPGPQDYAPIVQLLDEVVAKDPETITLDLKELNFLNSSGISMISKFVIKMRKHGKIQVVVSGSNTITWQKKSLKNLQKFLPTLKLELS